VEKPAKIPIKTEFCTGIYEIARKWNSGLPYPQNPSFPALTLTSALLRVCNRKALFGLLQTIDGPLVCCTQLALKQYLKDLE
jgi:hypothetical protein